ncbi:hypothetical protein APW84_14340 [Staphylococcus aureus]|nr:hypothetical protein APW84_14340 [Staphylococcus aureus]
MGKDSNIHEKLYDLIMCHLQRYKNENDQIKWYVDMGVIDKEEYALITGEKYPETKDEKSQV